MKRYRVHAPDFDTRANVLTLRIEESWEEPIKQKWVSAKDTIKRGLLDQYGARDAQEKLDNFVDLGPKPFSVLAFHNRFAEQVRHAFVIGSFYPALVGGCALGERILNHLILDLREDFNNTPEYNKVRDKNSFDNWNRAIRTLEAWDVLLPQAAEEFRQLAEIRNQRAIHFHPATDTDDRPLALEAILHLNGVVASQFGDGDAQPWYFFAEGAECYIKKQAENEPFVRKILLPNAWLVGPQHTLEQHEEFQFVALDENKYEDHLITDEEFLNLRNEARQAQLEALRTSREDG